MDCEITLRDCITSGFEGLTGDTTVMSGITLKVRLRKRFRNKRSSGLLGPWSFSTASPGGDNEVSDAARSFIGRGPRGDVWRFTPITASQRGASI